MGGIMTMSRLVRLFKQGPGLRPTEACIICGEPFGDMVHEITHAGSRHLYCHPTADESGEHQHECLAGSDHAAHLTQDNPCICRCGAKYFSADEDVWVDAPVQAAAAVAQHTPGPWRVTGDCIRSDNHPDGTGALLLQAGPMFHNYTPNKEEIAANLRLIAAAPDLLEAAIDLVQQVAAYDRLHGKDSCAIDPDALRAAIAAATGEEK
jgi:hypothetical protein